MSTSGSCFETLGGHGSFDETDDIGTSRAVVVVHAKSDCTAAGCRKGGIDAQGALTARTADNVKRGGWRSGSARGDGANTVDALIGRGEL